MMVHNCMEYIMVHREHVMAHMSYICVHIYIYIYIIYIYIGKQAVHHIPNCKRFYGTPGIYHCPQGLYYIMAGCLDSCWLAAYVAAG